MQTRDGVFESLDEALKFFRDKKPARQKFVNVLELEISGRPTYENFSGEHPEDWHKEICGALKAVAKHLGRRKVEAFEYYQIYRFPREEVAERYQVNSRTVGKWCWKVRDYLIEELIYRRLLPPDYLEMDR